MLFLTFKEDAMTGPAYTKLMYNHILISISDPDRKVNIPSVPHCKARLDLRFHDIQTAVDEKLTSFDASMADEILEFVNENINLADAIVVNCQAGISRSVAVASALSKILNHTDDQIFSHGLPNMLVYTTILDSYFSEPAYANKWPKIYYLRHQALSNNLTPVQVRLSEILATKSEKGER